jgi:hypothetical protein
MNSLISRTQTLRFVAQTGGTRGFAVSALRAKGPVDVAKDVLKTVDRKVSDKLVDGIEIGGEFLCWHSSQGDCEAGLMG